MHKTGFAFILLLAAPAFAQSVVPGKVVSENPSGEGDPLAVTCSTPQTLPGSRLPGPEVCKTNAVWAQYRHDGMDVAADGIHDVASEKSRSTNPDTCTRAPVGGGDTSHMNTMSFSPICF